jgi:hypothetical protein
MYVYPSLIRSNSARAPQGLDSHRRELWSSCGDVETVITYRHSRSQMRRFAYTAAFLLLFLVRCSPMLVAQSKPDFSGVWQQDNAHSLPARSGEVTLRIVYRDPELSIETTILRTGQAKQYALQRYTTDGRQSTSTGADGDHFVTRIVWNEDTLIFSIIEHEGGRTITSSEIWSISDSGETLKRVRRSSKADGQRFIFYRRGQ